MKMIGLIGGMSWESTVEYYRLINRMVAERLGGWHSARILIHSVDFAEIEKLQHQNRWDETARILGRAGASLAKAGADFLVLATNTMHKVAEEIEQAAGLPLLHLADVTGQAIRDRGLDTVGLLGTRFTMEQPFYSKRLEERFALRILIPAESDRKTIHRVIYDELCKGQVRPASREAYLGFISRLADRGAQGIVLGCTEIPLLVKPEDLEIPLFDTTSLHARAAVEWALAGTTRVR